MRPPRRQRRSCASCRPGWTPCAWGWTTTTDARAKLVTVVKDLGAKLMPTIEAAMATPVVGDTLKPFVDDLRSKLNALGTT